MAAKPEDLSSTIFKGAAVLTAAAILTKILSAFYRIPYQNIAGDLGFYIYQQVYPFYGISVILSTYGFPVVISKLIAEHSREKEEKHIIAAISFMILAFIGLVLFLGIFLGSDWIAAGMGDQNLAPLLRVSSFAFLFMPVISVIRGFFQGNNEMLPTAVSQIAEQSIRVLFIIGVTYLLLKQGNSLYTAGAGAVLGSVIGALASVLTLITFLWTGKYKFELTTFSYRRVKEIAGALFIQGTAFCISSLLLTLTQLIDSFTLYSLLLDTGLEERAAKELKGIFDRGQPLLQLGSIAATSLSLAIVPLLSSSRAKNDSRYLTRKVKLALAVTITTGAAATLGLISIITPVNIMLFTDDSGSDTLAVLAITILFSSLITISSAILQSIGVLWPTMLFILTGIGIKFLLNLWMIPILSIKGAAISTAAAYVFICAAHFSLLHKKLKGSLIDTGHIRIWLTAAVCMAAVLCVHTWIFSLIGADSRQGRMFSSIQALTGVLAGAFVYMKLILGSGMFAPEELSLLPFGSRLSLISQNKNNKRS
ncbi:putative polysaccharide biosynthesis protein [Peribacillus deserti]|uniref:Polysaccharide biosynthesis protein n=1 Tax=Peribacillus deserti TaxID=673318 RepID=A0A2N5M925_9BACI|nr:polysaccharide biosynthesis protein [Peribacillus deserti]PLT30850.1 polysaccharide biosynthesis protein [Peribacillus deserti]